MTITNKTKLSEVRRAIEDALRPLTGKSVSTLWGAKKYNFNHFHKEVGEILAPLFEGTELEYRTWSVFLGDNRAPGEEPFVIEWNLEERARSKVVGEIRVKDNDYLNMLGKNNDTVECLQFIIDAWKRINRRTALEESIKRHEREISEAKRSLITNDEEYRTIRKNLNDVRGE
jgi:hypothetical protein